MSVCWEWRGGTKTACQVQENSLGWWTIHIQFTETSSTIWQEVGEMILLCRILLNYGWPELSRILICFLIISEIDQSNAIPFLWQSVLPGFSVPNVAINSLSDGEIGFRCVTHLLPIAPLNFYIPYFNRDQILGVVETICSECDPTQLDTKTVTESWKNMYFVLLKYDGNDRLISQKNPLIIFCVQTNDFARFLLDQIRDDISL